MRGDSISSIRRRVASRPMVEVSCLTVVRRGEIYGLIGKNGAGKTTLMRMLLGMSAPNSGEIRLFDSDKPNEARRGIGSLIEEPALYKNHTAFENLKRFAILVPTPDDELHELLKLVGLENTGRKKAGQFSLGMKQRLGIAIAMLGKPELLILDEPINGLDPAGIKEIRDLILRLNARGITFMISSHLLDELGKIATQFGIMANGSLVEEISSEKLAEKSRASLRVSVDDSEKAAAALRTKMPDIAVECFEKEVRITSELQDTSEVPLTLVNAGVRVYEMRSEGVSLEDFFLERMG